MSKEFKNIYYRRSRITEADFGLVVHSYMLNVNAKQALPDTVSYTTKKNLYKKFRQYIFDNISSTSNDTNMDFDGYCFAYNKQSKKNNHIIFFAFTKEDSPQCLSVCIIDNIAKLRVLLPLAKKEILKSRMRQIDDIKLRNLYIRYEANTTKKEVYQSNIEDLREKIMTDKNPQIQNKILQLTLDTWNSERFQCIAGYDIHFLPSDKDIHNIFKSFWCNAAIVLHPYSGLDCKDINLYLAECVYKFNHSIADLVPTFLASLCNRPLNS